MEVDAVQTQKRPLTEHQKKLMTEGRCFHCEVQGHLSHDCPKKTNGPPVFKNLSCSSTNYDHGLHIGSGNGKN